MVHIVQGVIRWRGRLDWVIRQTASFPMKKISPQVLNILRIGVYQILFMDRVPDSAAVNEAVNLAKKSGPRHAVASVNGILRSICRNRGRVAFPDPEKDYETYLSVTQSYPLWLTRMWIHELGLTEIEPLMSSQNRIPGLCVRANRLKRSREEVIQILQKEGVTGQPTRFSPEGVRLDGLRGPVDGLEAFQKGYFQVQDEAAQIVSQFLRPQPGDTILDLCAGYGGKSTHLAELMDGKGTVLALDNSVRRLLSLGRNAHRLGIRILRPLAADASGDLASLFKDCINKILVDAPCSGLGVLARHPDGKWRREERDIQRLSGLQGKILERAWGVLAPGGWILYVTCTLSRRENQGVVKDFLSRYPDMSLLDLGKHGPDWAQDLMNPDGTFQSLPNRHGMDGFFAALMEKRKSKLKAES
jgi:16S rRNA (cytosine967-C5)-methyltransferase